MARLTKGDHVVETTNPRETVTLKAQGYRVEEQAKPAPKAPAKAPKADADKN